MNKNRKTINRRTLLQGLGATGAVSLAGCSSSQDSGEDGEDGGGNSAGKSPDELGERVPTLDLEYWTALGGLTRFFESSLPSIEKAWAERLGIELNTTGKEIAAQWSGTNEDDRTHHIAYWGYTTNAERLDPNFGIKTLRIDSAGANGSQNGANYASCEHSVPGFEQEITADPEKRQELVNEAEYAQSKDIAMIPTGHRARIGAARSDQIEVKDDGNLGIQNGNPFFVCNSVPTDEPGRRVIGSTNQGRLENINPLIGTQWGKPAWNYLIYSPLVVRGPDAELHPYTAEDWEVNNDGKQLKFYLRDMAFHDGRELTAEDVKFTYELIDEYAEDLPAAAHIRSGAQFESINAVDKKTVELNLANPSLSFLQAQIVQCGILNKEHWIEEGAAENPGDYDGVPGHQSGPFKVVQINRNQSYIMDTHPGHPEAPDPEEMEGLVLRGFSDESSKVRAFNQGEIDHMTDLSRQEAARLREQDNAYVSAALAGHTYHLNPQYPFGPTKFREFRLALAKAINRQEILDLTDPAGQFEPILHARAFLDQHPWSPPTEGYTKITDSPTGEMEGAKQVLIDEGWGWDDDGNLRYPADADLSPRWSKGEEPSPEDYPCLEEYGGAEG